MSEDWLSLGCKLRGVSVRHNTQRTDAPSLPIERGYDLFGIFCPNRSRCRMSPSGLRRLRPLPMFLVG